MRWRGKHVGRICSVEKGSRGGRQRHTDTYGWVNVNEMPINEERRTKSLSRKTFFF